MYILKNHDENGKASIFIALKLKENRKKELQSFFYKLNLYPSVRFVRYFKPLLNKACTIQNEQVILSTRLRHPHQQSILLDYGRKLQKFFGRDRDLFRAINLAVTEMSVETVNLLSHNILKFKLFFYVGINFEFYVRLLSSYGGTSYFFFLKFNFGHFGQIFLLGPMTKKLLSVQEISLANSV